MRAVAARLREADPAVLARADETAGGPRWPSCWTCSPSSWPTWPAASRPPTSCTSPPCDRCPRRPRDGRRERDHGAPLHGPAPDPVQLRRRGDPPTGGPTWCPGTPPGRPASTHRVTVAAGRAVQQRERGPVRQPIGLPRGAHPAHGARRARGQPGRGRPGRCPTWTPWTPGGLAAGRPGGGHRRHGGRGAGDAAAVAEVLLGPEVSTYAAGVFSPGRPLGETLTALVTRIHAGLRLPGRGDVGLTTLAEVLRRRQGVCQDFAHVAVGACAASGCRPATSAATWRPARRPARPRLVGADASHAWASVLVPGARLGRPRPDQRPARRRLATS